MSELFEGSEYDDPQLALPTFDEQGVDALALKFSGTVALTRSATEDVALWRSLSLGETVDLRVAVRVARMSGRGAFDDLGDLEAVTGERALVVTTVYPSPRAVEGEQ